MGAGTESRRDEAERLRGFLAAQLRFAEIVADRSGRPLADVCLTLTNLHRRLGLGRIEGGAAAPGWARYAEGLARCATAPERLDWTVDCFVAAPPAARDAHPFGCFSYELLEAGAVVRIHFGNRDSEDGIGPLAAAKAERRRAELAAMFGDIGRRHPQARRVRGGSWLYNLEAYRRLFPPAYVASIVTPARVRLDGTSSWGQLLDFRGGVKPAVAQAVLEAIARVDLAQPWTAFPLRALAAESGVEGFYGFYGPP